MAVVEAGLHLPPRGDVPDKSHLWSKDEGDKLARAKKEEKQQQEKDGLCIAVVRLPVVCVSGTVHLQKREIID